MATLTIRNLPDEVRDRLRMRAAQNGRSMEAEARVALLESLTPEREKPNLDAIRERLRKAQQDIAPYLPKDRSLVDEFLAERKKMWGEE